MRKCILIMLGALVLSPVVVADGKTEADKKAEIEKLRAEIRDLVEPKTIPGGKSLQDIFGMWFAKVDQTADNGLSLRLMRGGTHRVTIRILRRDGGRSLKYIGAGNTVTIAPGTSECIGMEGLPLEIGIDKALFPVEGCAWLSNSTHTAYVRMKQYNEFKPTTIADAFVISLDLKKAYSLEKKQDVDYPFPFVNPRPDISQEEWELQRAVPGYLHHIEGLTKEYQDACSPVVPEMRRVLGPKKDRDGVVQTDYVIFAEDCRSLICAKYFPGCGEFEVEVGLYGFDYKNNMFKVMTLNGKGMPKPCNVIDKGKFTKNKDEVFKRAFAREVINRLKLTASDLPGINLDAILAEPEVKK